MRPHCTGCLANCFFYLTIYCEPLPKSLSMFFFNDRVLYDTIIYLASSILSDIYFVFNFLLL